MRALGHGRFELEAVLGTGGSAVVYRAMDTVLGVRRAVKVVGEGSTSAASRTRLLAEARAMAQVTHPHILRIHDVLSEGGDDFIVMDLAPRGSLEDRLGREGPLPAAEAVTRILEVLSALDTAHRAGIVHRDVKPANILIGADGGALLADFGIARIADESLRQTRVGAALGSVAFMPPEQRLDARSVGPTADIYAVAATLYSLVTASNPVDLFLADPSSPRWGSVPPALRPILLRATSADAELRHPDVGVLADELLGALHTLRSTPAAEAHRPFPSPPFLDTGVAPTLAEGAAPRPPRRRTAGVLALFVVIVITLGWAFWPAAPTLPDAAPPEPARATTPVVAVVPTAAIVTAPPAPPTEVAVAVTPAPSAPAAAKPKPKPATALSGFGRWTGSFGGRNAELRLDGEPTALRGELIVRLGGRSVTSPVSGAWADGSLQLKDDLDSEDAGTYRARLGPDRSVIEGTFTRKDGSTIPLKLSATTP
jgi:hypothetical protein